MSTPVVNLNEIHASVRQQFKNGEIGQNTYLKGAIWIAAKFAEEGSMEDALSIVGKLPDEYLDHTLFSQMETDPTFGETVHRLAVRLSNAGLAIPPGEEITAAVSVRVTTSAQN